MDSGLLALLEQHKKYFTSQPNGRIKCEINGHDFPPRLDALTAFISGGKYPRLKAQYDADKALAKYEPFIVKSKNFPTMLYCSLTGQLIGQSMAAIKKHMQGKKFIKAKDRFTEDKQELKPEPGISIRKKAGASGEEGEEEGEDGGEEDGEEPEFWLEEAGASGAAADGEDDDSEGGEAMEEDRPGTAGDEMDAEGAQVIGDGAEAFEFEEGEKPARPTPAAPAPAAAAAAAAAGRKGRGSKKKPKPVAAAAAAAAAASGDVQQQQQQQRQKKQKAKRSAAGRGKAEGAGGEGVAAAAGQPQQQQAPKQVPAEKQALAEQLAQVHEADASGPKVGSRAELNKPPKKKNVTRPSATKRARA